jgi:hypothetical protein
LRVLEGDMSRNRRPQRGWAQYARASWRDSLAFLEVKLRKDGRRDARQEEARIDRKDGDCAACGWITGRSACPRCGEPIERAV